MGWKDFERRLVYDLDGCLEGWVGGTAGFVAGRNLIGVGCKRQETWDSKLKVG